MTGRNGASRVLDSKFSSEAEVRAAMLQKLTASALTRQHAATMRLLPCTASAVTGYKLPVARAGFSIPYFTLKGGLSNFYRFRYLEYGHNRGFDKLVADSLKQLRYAQPAKTTPELYLPPFLDWSEYAADVSKPLVLTEGELKAACATVHGIPTIGLGGVWSFRSADKHMPLLVDFEQFNWKDRRVIVCYDSDAATNWQVIRAENALCRELLRIGALPAVARLPALQEGHKTGMDDYIVAHGADRLMEEVLLEAQQFKAAQELFQLNEEVLYVQDPGLILRLDTLQKMAVRAFTEHAYAPRVYYEEVATKTGVSMQEKSAPREWLKWPQRATVARVTYEPGGERVTAARCLNTWRGWGCTPVQGDCKPWTDLLDFLFLDAQKDDREWFERWLAYPLQYPGTKLYTAAVVWGIYHGTGKSLVGYTMLQIYGEANATEIGDRELHGSFNEWAENKQFVMGDEITGGDKRGTADRMKSMITQRQLRLNPKYVPSYTVPDCINYYFTSNHPDAFFLEDTDRRFFVHEVRHQPKPTAFYDRYIRWLKDEQGAQRLFHRLLTLNCDAFHPQGHAPRTTSKMDMIDLGRSDLANWVYALVEEPDRVLKVAGCGVPFKLFTSEELRILYDPEGKTRVTTNGMSRELRRAGFCRAAQGQLIRTELQGSTRLWVVRDMAQVRKLDSKALGALYDAERKGVKIVNEKKKF